MPLRRRHFTEAVVVVAAKLAGGALTLVLGLAMAAWATPADYGIYAYAVTLVLLADAVIGTPFDLATIRLAQAIVAENPDRAAAIERQALTMKTLVAVGVALVLVGGLGLNSTDLTPISGAPTILNLFNESVSSKPTELTSWDLAYLRGLYESSDTPRNTRQHFGALLLGYYDNGQLIYAGHSGGGFSDRLLAEIGTKLRKIERKTSPFTTTPQTNERAHWVDPRYVAEVKFNEWTAGGNLRQPIFLGLRGDKDPRSVVKENGAMATAKRATDNNFFISYRCTAVTAPRRCGCRSCPILCPAARGRQRRGECLWQRAQESGPAYWSKRVCLPKRIYRPFHAGHHSGQMQAHSPVEIAS